MGEESPSAGLVPERRPRLAVIAASSGESAMPEFTTNQWAVLFLVLVLGWLLGLMSSSGGARWRRQYEAEHDARLAAERDRDERLALERDRDNRAYEERVAIDESRRPSVL
jgi:hypothetical protein